MGRETGISWTNHTFNPWRGCDEVSEACDDCYAKRMAKRTPQMLGQWGDMAEGGTRVVAVDKTWNDPLRWDADAFKSRERRRVFCCSIADVFEEWQGPMTDKDNSIIYKGNKLPLTMEDCRQRLFAMIQKTTWLNWLLLTKRPEHQKRWLEEFYRDNKPLLTNVWAGTTVELQDYASRLDTLLETNAVRLWVSVEPLLGPITLEKWLATGLLDWVIVGGEASGPGSTRRARVMKAKWVDALFEECQKYGVAFFFKQWGDYLSFEYGSPCLRWEGTSLVGANVGGTDYEPRDITLVDDTAYVKVGKGKAGDTYRGRQWHEVPESIPLSTG